MIDDHDENVDDPPDGHNYKIRPDNPKQQLHKSKHHFQPLYLRTKRPELLFSSLCNGNESKVWRSFVFHNLDFKQDPHLMLRDEILMQPQLHFRVSPT